MHSRTSHNRRLLFYTLCLAYICAGIISILPGPTLPLLAAHNSVPLDIAGWIFTSSASGFVLGAVIAGILSRFGPKYILLSGLLLMVLAGIVTPWTHLFSLLLTVQFLQGVGFGFLDVSINMSVTLTFEDILSETLNNIHSAYGIGALVAPLFLSFALQITHEAFLAYLAGSIVGCACIFLLLQQRIPSVTKLHKAQQHHSSGTFRFSPILRQPLLWLMALQIGLYVAAEVGFGNWIVTAVSQSAAISLALAAPCATFLFLGLTVGRLVGAQALRRSIVSENKLLYICVIGSAISASIVALFPGQIAISFSASALVGFFFGPIFPGIMAIASRWFVHALSTVSGVLLISAGVAAMVLPVLMGYLIPHIGINWVIALPGLVCLSIIIPHSLAFRQRRSALQLASDAHTMEHETQLPIPK